MKYNTKIGLALVGLLTTFVVASAESIENLDSNVTALTMSHFIPSDVELFDSNGNKVSHDALEGKYVGIYFSAPWCSPCKPFTSRLRIFRNINRDDFEVVFISLDKAHTNTNKSNLAKKFDYIKKSKMPGYTINIKYETAIRLYLDTEKKGIPNVIVFSPEGKYVTNKGRVDIRFRALTTLETWKKMGK